MFLTQTWRTTTSRSLKKHITPGAVVLHGRAQLPPQYVLVMDDDTTGAEDERAIELSSIAAIFPELVVDPKNPFHASIDLPVDPTKALRVLFRPLADAAPPAPLLTPPSSIDAGDGKDGDGNAQQVEGLVPQPDVHPLSHLPPLTVDIQLPEGYPSDKPPRFHLSTTPPWLPQNILHKLSEEGCNLWEELGKDQVVYSYIDHLKELAEQAFDLVTGENDCAEFPQDIKIALLDFDQKANREKFEQETFDCGVCLEPKKGAVCHRLLLCGHVFCLDCLQDFYKNAITEGDVDSVKCLAIGCGKERAQAAESTKKRRQLDQTLSPSELLQIALPQETVQRYVTLKRKKRLESDRNTVYCPREWCQAPAKSKKLAKLENEADLGSEDEDEDEAPVPWDEDHPPPMSERLATCSECLYSFCIVCKKGWHGELGLCTTRVKAEISAEEKATADYLRHYSTPCPTCAAPCQKTHGCNHMICGRCNTHFCYLCSAWLEVTNPYKHFNEQGSSCYMRLWELEAGDGEGVIQHYGGGDAVEIPEEPEDDTDNEDDLPPPPAPVPPRGRGPPAAAVVNAQAIMDGLRRRVEDQAQRIDNLERAARQLRIDVQDFDPRARGRGGRRGQRGRGGGRQQQGQVAAQPQGNQQGRAGANPGPGLQRFLDLARNDGEDEWDSDELDDDSDDDAWAIPER